MEVKNEKGPETDLPGVRGAQQSAPPMEKNPTHAVVVVKIPRNLREGRFRPLSGVGFSTKIFENLEV